jgi:hypothetical protein
MEYYHIIGLFFGTIAVSMIRDYIEVSYEHKIKKNN